MILGVAYYPEHWPHERWETDARLMQEAGITRVRMAEFAWHRMEPREGQFDFGWLEEAIDLLARHGIETILGTPTPTYPAWLHDIYPDIHQIKSNGQVKEWGQRQDACKNHLGYRAYARRIVEQMTAALGQNPARRRLADRQRVRLSQHGALPLPELRPSVPLLAAPALRQRHRQRSTRPGARSSGARTTTTSTRFGRRWIPPTGRPTTGRIPAWWWTSIASRPTCRSRSTVSRPRSSAATRRAGRSPTT